MGVDDIFPEQWCINLDRRLNRWHRSQSHFRERGLTRVKRFTAVDGLKVEVPKEYACSPGVYGCLQSHMALIRLARSEGWPAVLIFEDDVVLAEDFQERFQEGIVDLPDDWAMLFFGADHLLRPGPVAGHIHRIKQSLSTFAYALHERVYDAFIELNSRVAVPVDRNNWTLQKNFSCYGFMPHLAWVEAGHSDTQNLAFNPWWLRHSLVAKGPETDVLLAQTLMVIFYKDSRAGDGLMELNFILGPYLRYTDVKLVVVDSGETPSLDPKVLPKEVSYLFFQSCEDLDYGACLTDVVERFGKAASYLVLSDSRTVIAMDQYRASLAQCQTYDVVVPHNKKISLNREDSSYLIKTNGAGLNLGAYTPLQFTGTEPKVVFLTVKGLESLKKEALANGGIFFEQIPEMENCFEAEGLSIALNTLED